MLFGGKPKMRKMTDRLLELDVRHGELLDRLSLLDQLVNDLLNEWTKPQEVLASETLPIDLLENCSGMVLQKSA
ncbi:hypothetical protein FACS1894189_8000 [Planctomycetales bacterium]|nr:hypothetical protein FACS1894189_8000 [Planctomycetales bacterium]